MSKSKSKKKSAPTGAIRWNSNGESVLHQHERETIESAQEFPWAVHRGTVHRSDDGTLWLDSGEPSPMLLGDA